MNQSQDVISLVCETIISISKCGDNKLEKITEVLKLVKNAVEDDSNDTLNDIPENNEKFGDVTFYNESNDKINQYVGQFVKPVDEKKVLKKDKREVNEINELLRAEKKKLNDDNNNLQNRYNSLNEEKNDLQNRYNSLDAEKNDLHNRYKSLNEEKNDLQNRYNSLNAAKNDLQNSYDRLDEEKNDMEEIINSIPDFEKIKSFSDYISRLHEEIKNIDIFRQFDFNSVAQILVNCGHPTRLRNAWQVLWQKAVETGIRNDELSELMTKMIEFYNEANQNAQLHVIRPEINVSYSSSEHEHPRGKKVSYINEVIFPGLRNDREVLYKPVVG